MDTERTEKGVKSRSEVFGARFSLFFYAPCKKKSVQVKECLVVVVVVFGNKKEIFLTCVRERGPRRLTVSGNIERLLHRIQK